jgi:hypothetical protein
MQLYDHQKKALHNMKNGCILNGGVGSGKSITALAYYYKCYGGDITTNPVTEMSKPANLYIITTAQKRDKLEWDGELCYFYMSRNGDCNIYDNAIYIDSWNNIQKYTEVSNAFFIFDEDRICGSGAWVKAFYKIAKKNQWIVLSATPGDCWADYIPIFVANGFYKNKTDFEREHVVWSRYCKFPKIDRYVNTRRLERLRDCVLVDMEFERHTKRINEFVNVDYDQYMYRRVMRDRWNVFEDWPLVNASELCYALRRVVNSDESRREAVLDIFSEHPRSIIFYNFDYELELLKDLDYSAALGGPDVIVHEWNGHKHQEIPESPFWVYLVQYTAGCEGWNCIKTDTVIFFSQNYSYKVLEQASGRIDRLNTAFLDLYYFHLVSKAPIDISIRRALDRKQKFNERRFVEW